MEIIYKKIGEVKPYGKNPRKNKAAIEYVANSIKEFGFKNPIIIDKDNIIVAGHTRLEAAKKLGYDEVPCVMADDLSDEQVKAFRLADNKTAEYAKWDLAMLEEEMNGIFGLDMELFGFDPNENAKSLSDAYSVKVSIPQYEPTGEKPKLSDLYDTTKADKLIEDIENSDISEELKDFLYDAAKRHTVFNYKNIAEYYANAEPEVQRLFEDSALVIIDIDDAIAKGYCTLAEEIKSLRENEE